MRSIEDYIDRILFEASLAPHDEKRVRHELEDHLNEIIEISVNGDLPKEIIMEKLEKDFGNPEELGRTIARAKGRFKTYLKKEMRPYKLIIALAVAIPLKMFAITNFRVGSGEYLPVGVEAGNYVLVNKLARTYGPNDIVVVKGEQGYKVWKVKAVFASENKMVVQNKGLDEREVSNEDIAGRVFLQVR